MKKIFTILTIFLSTLVSNAQSNSEYLKYRENTYIDSNGYSIKIEPFITQTDGLKMMIYNNDTMYVPIYRNFPAASHLKNYCNEQSFATGFYVVGIATMASSALLYKSSDQEDRKLATGVFMVGSGLSFIGWIIDRSSNGHLRKLSNALSGKIQF